MNDIFRELKRGVDFDFEHNDAYTVVSQMLVEWCEVRGRYFSDLIIKIKAGDYEGIVFESFDSNNYCIEFLTELTKLTDKYGFEIGGCGCCGSPGVTSDGIDGGVDLTYDEEKCCYRVDLDSSRGYHEPIYVYGNRED